VFQSAVENILTPETLSEQPFSPLQAFQRILRILFEGALTGDARVTIHLSSKFPAEISPTEFSNER
jgi:hypothetical protein